MIQLQFVTSNGCEHCEAVKEILDQLNSEYALEIREIDMSSEQGLELVLKYQITAAPAVIASNELISVGQTSEEKLRSKLDSIKVNSPS